MGRLTLVAVLCALLAAPAAAGAASAVDQLVVFRDGRARLDRVAARIASVRVAGRRCAVAGATPLAALVRSRVARLRLLDFGSCSGRARAGGGLFVSAIGGDRSRGQAGWVYKVGPRVGTAGAADPRGPFGRGRLRAGARVLWFYCLRAGACQRTLSVIPDVDDSGAVVVRVRAHDDEGRAVPAGGATVRAGGVSATADGEGVARLALPGGRHRIHAEAEGTVRSFPEELTVP